MTVHEMSWPRWVGTTLEIVELFEEASQIMENGAGAKPSRTFEMEFPDGFQAVGSGEDLERKLRARYRSASSIRVNVWLAAKDGGTFPTEDDVAATESPVSEQKQGDWTVGPAAARPIGVEMTWSRTGGAALKVIGTSGYSWAIFDQMNNLMALGGRTKWSDPLSWGILAADLTVIGVLVACALGAHLSGAGLERVIGSLLIGAFVGIPTFCWASWAFPPLEIIREGETRRIVRSRGLALDLLGITLGIAGIVLAILLGPSN